MAGTFRSMISFFAFSSSCFVGSSFASGAFACSVSGAMFSSAFAALSASVDCHLRPILEEYEAGTDDRGEMKVAEENGERRRICGDAARDSEMARDCRRTCLRSIVHGIENLEGGSSNSTGGDGEGEE